MAFQDVVLAIGRVRGWVGRVGSALFLDLFALLLVRGHERENIKEEEKGKKKEKRNFVKS